MTAHFSKKSFFGAAMGTLIEYYDYALLTMFLPIISPLFFPSDTPYQSLIKGYYFLLITMLIRPLGGILFGHIGDSLGRRKALLSSMYGIAFATFIIGLTPSYAMIGAWATIIIIIAKSVQMFCFGGEYNGAGIYVVEHARLNQEGWIGSLLSATTLAGSLLASLFGVLLTLKFMPLWSWRIAFVFGGLLGVFAIFYRKNLIESPHFKPIMLKQHRLVDLLKLYPREMLAGFFLGGFATAPFMTVLAFVNPVLMSKGFFSNHQYMLIQTLLSLIAMIVLLLIGVIADKKTPHKVMQVGCLALTIFAYPLLWIMDSGQLLWIILMQALLIIINEITLGPCHAYLKNLFSMPYRYRGSSLSFCLGLSLFGGLTPIVENYLYHITGKFSLVSLWLIFVGLGTGTTLHLVKKNLSMRTIKKNLSVPLDTDSICL